MMNRRCVALGVAVGLVGACSGKAIVDGQGSTGAGGSTTTATTTISTSATTTATTTPAGIGGSVDPCTALGEALIDALAVAQYCNPALSVPQCSGQNVVFDQCGCEVAANDGLPDEGQLALEAYDAWVDAGCGPWDCTMCPLPPSTGGWFCHPDHQQCWPPGQQ